MAYIRKTTDGLNFLHLFVLFLYQHNPLNGTNWFALFLLYTHTQYIPATFDLSSRYYRDIQYYVLYSFYPFGNVTPPLFPAARQQNVRSNKENPVVSALSFCQWYRL